MATLRMNTARGSIIAALACSLICAYGSPMRGDQQPESKVPPQGKSQQGQQSKPLNDPDDKPTELWVMGIATKPSLAVPIKAMGVRGFANLRKNKKQIASSMLREAKKNNLGLAITLRWVDPKQANKDLPPSQHEGEAALNQLMKVLKSPEAQRMDGRLWIGFYSEPAAGGGAIPFDQSDEALAWAAQVSRRVRAETPWVRLVGPGLTKVDVLTKDRSKLGPKAQEYYDYVDRIIRWCVQYTDAIDLHLHVDSVEDAEQRIKIVREHLAKIPGSDKIRLVAQEWSPAYYPNRTDLAEVERTILGIYRVMNENNFLWSGYGAYYTFEGQPEVFHWKNLTDNKTKGPHEPYYSIFVNLAEKVRANDVADIGR